MESSGIKFKWFNSVDNAFFKIGNMDKWFGLKVNFKWPHEGICLGIAFDFFEEDETAPWCSILVRCLFLTIIYDYGIGDESRDAYNNQV